MAVHNPIHIQFGKSDYQPALWNDMEENFLLKWACVEYANITPRCFSVRRSQRES
jgi:hypothetical protein